jgi:hypothetical protein
MGYQSHYYYTPSMKALNAVSCRWPDTFPAFQPSSYELVLIKRVFDMAHPTVTQKILQKFEASNLIS